MQKHHLKMVVSFLLASGLAGCGGAGSNSALNPIGSLADQMPTAQNGLLRAPSSSMPSVASANQESVNPATPNAAVMAMNVGGNASGSWMADQYYSGGWLASPVTAPINTSGVAEPAPQTVYQTQRCGKSFTYTLPNLKPNATYTVRLHMAETFWHASGQRLFNVSVNGSQALTNFDIFAAAGGANIAIAKALYTTADASGKITLQFNAVLDNATLAGIAVFASSAAPPPSPTPSPSPSTTPMPMGNTLSALFTGNTPFHHQVATLERYGAQLRPDAVAANYWANSVQTTRSFEQNPVWSVRPGSPSYTFQCPVYASSPSDSCSAFHRQVYFPYGAAAECLDAPGTCTYDYHIISSDGVYNNAETDGWGETYSTFNMNPNGASAADPGCNGSGTCAGGCQLTAGQAYCAWGAYFPFNSSGLVVDSTAQPNSFYSKANAAGYAYGLFEVDSQDLMNAKRGIPIAHALGIATACEGSSNESATPNVYPSSASFGTDMACHSNNLPNMVYGNLLHLKTSFVMPSRMSTECRAVLTALQQYGAYTVDNNDYNGTAILTNQYVTNPSSWSVIQADMNAAGEGQGGGMSWSSDWCLHYISSSSQLEVLQVNQGGTGALPPVSSI